MKFIIFCDGSAILSQYKYAVLYYSCLNLDREWTNNIRGSVPILKLM